MWYSSEAMALVERSDGEIGKNFPSNDKLDCLKLIKTYGTGGIVSYSD